MEKFTVYNPTKLIFGKNAIEKLPENIINCGKKALIVYGKNSAKKFGYFKQVTDQLDKAGVEYAEFGGIKPNPVVDDVRNAVELCRKENIDFIIAIGGGSVIDSAKIISLSYANNQDAWEIMKYKVICSKSIPVFVVLTLAATGSEMNPFAVIQNHETHEKIGFGCDFSFPKVAFLDPDYTLTVTRDYTVYGIADMVAHSLEAYFAGGQAELSDRFVASVLNEIFEVAPLLLKDLKNHDYRARIMWASTVALNGTLYSGRLSSGDWGVHSIGHVLSYLFDTPHGATLSIAYPAWMRHLKPRIEDRLIKLGTLITGKKTSADKTIDLIEKFFVSINTPISLRDIDICESDLPNIKHYMIHTEANGDNYKLDENDLEKILKLMLK